MSNFQDPWVIWEDKIKLKSKKEFEKIQYERKDDNGEWIIDEFSVPINTPWIGGDKKVVGTVAGNYNTSVITSGDVGNKLDLIPDPENPYDRNAIKVCYKGEQIGNLGQSRPFPKWNGSKVKSLLDEGFNVEARITYVLGGDRHLEKCKSYDEFIETLEMKFPLGVDKLTTKQKEQGWELLQKKQFNKLGELLCQELHNKGIGYSLFVTRNEQQENPEENPEERIEERIDLINKPSFTSTKGTKSDLSFYD